MSMLMNILMVVSGIAAIVLLRKTGKVAWAKPAAIVLAAVTVALALAKVLPLGGDRAGDALAAHTRYEEVCGAVLGESLVTRHPEARVVILVPPRPKNPTLAAEMGTQVLADSLRTALEGKVTSVAIRTLEVPGEKKARLEGTRQDDAEAPDAMADMMLMDTSMWFKSSDLAQLLDELRDEADLVVSTIDLSMGVEPDALPASGEAPAVVLVNAPMRDIPGALRDTSLDTIVLNRPGSNPWQTGTKVPLGTEEAFNQRYLLVTLDNVDSVAGQLPKF